MLSGLLSSEPDPLFNKNVRSCSSARQYALKPQKKQVNFLFSQKPINSASISLGQKKKNDLTWFIKYLFFYYNICAVMI